MFPYSAKLSDNIFSSTPHDKLPINRVGVAADCGRSPFGFLLVLECESLRLVALSIRISLPSRVKPFFSCADLADAASLNST